MKGNAMQLTILSNAEQKKEAIKLMVAAASEINAIKAGRLGEERAPHSRARYAQGSELLSLVA